MRKTIKKLFVSFIAVTLATGSLHYYVNDTKTVQASDEYVVVWEDQFEGNSLNRNYWNVEHNGDGGGNQELQFYRDSTENIQVSNGTLKIKGLTQGYGGKSYTSGRINTRDKAEFRYGKIEARMKLPSFRGAWPAFWMLGGNHSEIGWPRCGEIDIMEAINTENYTHGALHWHAEGQKDGGNDSSGVLPDNFDRTQWHVYGMEWTETEIKMYVDGEVFYTESITDGYMGEFRKEQFIILNLAIGGQWPGFSVDNSKFPVTMEVDYVRVSQRASEANIVKGSGVKQVSPIVIPTETETRNVIEYTGPWTIFYNTAVVKGTGSSTDSKGYTANIEYLGSKGRLITASIRGIDYIPGNTYKYSCTFKSDINKYISIKAVGEDPEEDVFGNYTIFLSAGSPYKFSENVTIDKEYDGRVDLIVEMGGRIGGEYLPTNTSLTVQMSDASFTGVAGKLNEIPTPRPTTTQPTTTKAPTDTSQETTVPETTTSKVTEGNTKPQTTVNKETQPNLKNKKVKITSAKRSKNGKSIKLKIKKINGAQKYQIRYSTNKKVKKYKSVTTKKLNYTLKKLNAKKTYYIKVRAYRTVNGKKYYSSWSKVKKVKKK